MLMEPRPLSLDHKDLLFHRLRTIDIPISEFSFANLYLFRDIHRYQVISNGEIFIKGLSYDKDTFIIPTADVRLTDPDLLDGLLSTVDYLYPVPEQWLGAFSVSRYEVESRDGDSDYIYSVDKIATYAGKRMHKKKNLFNYFIKHYEHEAKPLTEERKPDAIRILNAWQEESKQAFGDTDYAACRESLVRMDELALCGGIYYADGEPAGFIHGEELNDETYALHFAKGLTRFKGIYQYMFGNFAGILPKKYHYLNFEQDLGLETLRHFKESYHPEFMLKKYRVRLIK
jgi:hypothetical protein